MTSNPPPPPPSSNGPVSDSASRGSHPAPASVPSPAPATAPLPAQDAGLAAVVPGARAAAKHANPHHHPGQLPMNDDDQKHNANHHHLPSPVSKDQLALIRKHITLHQDFPSPGVLFQDLLPVLRDQHAHQQLQDSLLAAVRLLAPGGSGNNHAAALVGLEARGFLLAAPLALRTGAAMVPARKPGKLPGTTVTAEFTKEYGREAFEMQTDALQPGQTVIIIDDVLATGGSAMAAAELVHKAQATLLGFVFVLEIPGLGGRARLGAPSVVLLD